MNIWENKGIGAIEQSEEIQTHIETRENRWKP